MRGELGVKPEKGHVLQDRSASGAQGLCLDAPESTCGLQAGVPAPASLTLRRKSGRRSQVKVDLACGEGGSSQAGEQEAEEGPSQHPGAPATPQSQQNSSRKRRRDGPGGLAAGPGGSPGLGPDEEAPTPRKLFAGGQTPTEAGSARCPGAALDKLPRRRSSPACVAMLRTDTGTQSPAILAPLPVQLERRVQKDPPHQPGTPRMPGLSPAGHSSFAESLSKSVQLYVSPR
ncbi:hypothetical protein J0S82_009699 [Galemys pyrenaicus]|uniref:Uncharacterized protein n=1 Tax=Galemys pyrenaicus TaxID=202257 RepID=A0A8J6DQU0_GALPY|nr:hypothetical protein J0S82_009699 [Galemys pyrenaicus]